MSKVKGFFKKDGKTRPITEKSKKSSYHGQKREASWKDSSVQMVKEEARKSRTYKNLHRSEKVYTYHGRSGHPVIHQDEDGEEFIMVRTEGGGTKRLYLDEETKRRLESEEGYIE
jgi:phage/plasmid primase-like uncharacterized protein